MLKMLRGVTTDVQLQQLANCMRILYISRHLYAHYITGRNETGRKSRQCRGTRYTLDGICEKGESRRVLL